MTRDPRWERLRRCLDDELQAILVTSLVNVRYLTGFTGSNGAVLVTADEVVLATDGRYATQAADEAAGAEILVCRAVGSDLVARAGAAGVERLGIERHVVTLAAGDRLTAAGHDAGVVLVDAGTPVEDLRVVKDDAELAALSRACEVTDEVFAAVVGDLRPGVTEREMAWRMRAEMWQRGAEPGFDSIVAFGDNSARPHHQPTDRPVALGDFVMLDFGAAVDGYHADMTRTVVLGPAADWQRDLHQLVTDIQADARRSATPGAVPVELDTAVRDRIESAGYDVAHGLGHGVGLEIHEAPFLVPGSTAGPLDVGAAVTIEPGVYLPGRGGVRIEDTVVIRDGEPTVLTRSPRELLEL
ncbi:MAG: aminopeptidase P family protein [Frankiales bacterium]|nr:aminopeptidase P family protein [Frankiales bacterium]